MKAKKTAPPKRQSRKWKPKTTTFDPRPIQRLLHGRANGDQQFDAADPAVTPDFIVNHVRIPNPFESQLAAVVKCATEGRDHALAEQRIAQDQLNGLRAEYANLRAVLQDILTAATILEQNLRAASRKQTNVRWAINLLANARKSSDKANGAFFAAKAQVATEAAWTEPT